MMCDPYFFNLIRYYLSGIIFVIGFSVFFCFLFYKFEKNTPAANKVLDKSPYIAAFLYFLFFWYIDNSLYIRSQLYTNIIINIFTAITNGTFTFTVNDFNKPMHIFGYYLAPLWVPLAYISKLFNHSPIFLHAFESAVLALGVIPIIKFSKEKFKDSILTLGFSLAYLLSFFIQTANLLSVEIRTMSTAVISWGLYFLFKKKNTKFLWAVLLFLLCGTPNSILIIFLGVYIFFGMKDKKLGAIVSIMGLMYFFVGMVVSFFVNEGVSLYAKQLFLLKSLILSPIELLKFLFTPKYFLVILLLLFPTAFFSLGSIGLLMIILPSLYMNFIIFNNIVDVLISCYGIADLVPVIIYSAIIGVGKIKKNNNKIGMGMLLLVVLSYLFFNPFSFQENYWPNRFSKISDADIRIKKMLDAIPKNASVSADNRYKILLADRPEIYMLGLSKPLDTDFVVISRYADMPAFDYAKKLLAGSSDYGVYDYADGVIVFKKNEKRGLKDYITADFSEIKNPASININNQLLLRGYNLNKKYFKPGDYCELTLFFEALDDIKEDMWFIVRFSKYNVVYSEIIYQPYYGFYPTSLWRKGDEFKEAIQIRVPRNIILSKEPSLLRIYPIKHLMVHNNKFSQQLTSLQSVKYDNEKLDDNTFATIQVCR